MNPNRIPALLCGLFCLLFLAAGCATPPPQAPTPTSPPPGPPAPEPELPPVNLIVPQPEANLTGAGITLEWNWIRKLRPNERFDVRVWKEGTPELGITLTEIPYLNLSNWLTYQEPGTYNWALYVVQTENNQPVRLLTPSSEIRQFTVTDITDPVASLSMPEGFEARLVTSLQTPTSIDMDSQGNLFVSTLGGQILRQTAENFGTDSYEIYAEGFEMPTGLLVEEGSVYVSHVGQVTILQDTDQDGVADERQDLLEPGVLPGRQYDSHSNNGMAIGPDGFLYLSVGGTTDHGPEEHPLGGVVLKIDQTSGEFDVFATGIRNGYDLMFDENGNLFGGDNGADAPDANLTFIPPDELNQIVAGGDYGYPNVFGQPPPDSDVIGPMIEIPASSATTGLAFYAGSQFPPNYEGALFVALWGNAVISHPTGHRVSVATRDADGTYAQSNFVDFVTGLNRPIDVTVSPDGALLIADFETGRIFEVTYTGG